MAVAMNPVLAGEQPTFDLEALNFKFAEADPKAVLAWCLENIPQGLIQSSAFSVSGMVIMDLLYRQLKPQPPVPVMFLDTLHHFPDTLELVHRATELYNLDLRIFKILDLDTRVDFAARYGEALWETDTSKFYQLTKVEPLQRGLRELGAIAWINGRRRDQSSARSSIPIFELDQQQRLKINPLATWTSRDVWAYVFEHNVIYNPLYDQGYTSIGDQPTTTPTHTLEDERAGRWRGSERTECGIHTEVTVS
jgi:phosphoadenosine phosphosulfate reductase